MKTKTQTELAMQANRLNFEIAQLQGMLNMLESDLETVRSQLHEMDELELDVTYQMTSKAKTKIKSLLFAMGLDTEE